jgi:hypothetical protein
MRRRRGKSSTGRPPQHRGRRPAEVTAAPSLAREPAVASGDLPTEIDASLRERARQIIAELEATSARDEVTTLEAWMAHYIAELIHRAEDASATPGERTAAARDCADSVLQLSQLRFAREQAQLGYLIYQDRWRETRRTGRALVAALRDPSSVRGWSFGERLRALFELARADEELIRALYFAGALRQRATVNPSRNSQRIRGASAAKSPTNAEASRKSTAAADADAPSQAESQEDGMQEGPPDAKQVQAALTRGVAAVGTLFPAVGRADPSDLSAFNIAIVEALEQTSRLRAVLFGISLVAEESGGRADSSRRSRLARSGRRRGQTR